MGILSWIVFGALAGWVASLIMGTNQRQGCLGNIIVGIVGALLGGFLIDLLGRGGANFAFNIRSFIVAVVGAVLLLGIVRMVRR